MRFFSFFPRIASTRALAGATLVLLASASLPARAEDLLGLYAGVAAGQGRVAVDDASFNGNSFRSNHAGLKALAGVRPIPIVGAEIEYVDMRNADGSVGFYAAEGTVNGAAAFAVGYLPLPIGAIFAKAGISRLRSAVDGSLAVGITCPVFGCAPFRAFSRTMTGAAGGAGVEFKLTSFTVRAEYERFNTAGGNLSLATFGVTWTFL